MKIRAELMEEVLGPLSDVGPLPALAGSTKQIEWARQLRDTYIEEALNYMFFNYRKPKHIKKFHAGLVAMIAEKTDSSWWIDTRYEPFNSPGKRTDTLIALAKGAERKES